MHSSSSNIISFHQNDLPASNVTTFLPSESECLQHNSLLLDSPPDPPCTKMSITSFDTKIDEAFMTSPLTVELAHLMRLTRRQRNKVVYVELSESSPPSKKGRPHALSRRKAGTSAAVRTSGGCWTCRVRHKACSQERPACQGCQRLEIPCDYSVARPLYMKNRKRANAKLMQMRARGPDQSPVYREG